MDTNKRYDESKRTSRLWLMLGVSSPSLGFDWLGSELAELQTGIKITFPDGSVEQWYLPETLTMEQQANELADVSEICRVNDWSMELWLE